MTVGDGQRTSPEVREGYAELLSRVPWSYFVTLTADPKRYPRMGFESWTKAWVWFHYQWLKSAAIAAGQARWDDQAEKLRGPWANAWRRGSGHPQWALALEPHRDDRLHAHALVRLTSDLPWLDYRIGQELWSKSGRGSWCRFEVPRSPADVCSYVSKYVVKCGSDAITFSDNFEAPRMPVCGESAATSALAGAPGNLCGDVPHMWH